MKENKVLSAIYGIALFAALMGIVGLFYNAIELLRYTSYGSSSNGYLSSAFYHFQKPVAITLLVTSIFAIAGVVGGTGNIFSKKRITKIIFLSCIAISVLAMLAAFISVLSIWNTYFLKDRKTIEGTVLIYSGATDVALYSTAMSSIIQNLVCVVVVAALMVYDFVKPIIENKRSSKSDNSSAEELQDINVSEKS